MPRVLEASMGVGMSWIKRDLYQPERTNIKTDEPLLVISPHRNWFLVRQEINQENPSYPVLIVVPKANIYGLRIRGYEYRHMSWKAYSPNEYAYIMEWEELSVKCRVGPQ